MEYVAGHTLRDVIAHAGAAGPGRGARPARPGLSALGRRPPRRADAPRRQARERPARPTTAGSRSPTSAWPGRSAPRPSTATAGRADRHRLLPVPRAGRRRQRRRPLRRLRRRRGALRDAHRAQAARRATPRSRSPTRTCTTTSRRRRRSPRRPSRRTSTRSSPGPPPGTATLRPADGRVLLPQVRRVRAALHDGIADDPELTQDLLPGPSARPDPGSAPTEVVGDRADFEATQHITSGLGAQEPAHPG